MRLRVGHPDGERDVEGIHPVAVEVPLQVCHRTPGPDNLMQIRNETPLKEITVPAQTLKLLPSGAAEAFELFAERDAFPKTFEIRVQVL